MPWNSPLRSPRGLPRIDAPLRQTPARILLLEDEEAVRDILAESLARHGYEVMAGASLVDGLQVLTALGWDQVDLVVSDTHLSRDAEVRDGRAFHDAWRSRYPVPPFIFMDGWGEPLDEAPVADGSCLVFLLPKPFPLPVLLGLIRAVLAR